MSLVRVQSVKSRKRRYRAQIVIFKRYIRNDSVLRGLGLQRTGVTKEKGRGTERLSPLSNAFLGDRPESKRKSSGAGEGDRLVNVPSPRIHSTSMHGFPKIHGYQHGYPLLLADNLQLSIQVSISTQWYPCKDILQWISVKKNIHEWISTFYGYQHSIIHTFMDIHMNILGFLWISMYWLAMDSRSRGCRDWMFCSRIYRAASSALQLIKIEHFTQPNNAEQIFVVCLFFWDFKNCPDNRWLTAEWYLYLGIPRLFVNRRSPTPKIF